MGLQTVWPACAAVSSQAVSVNRRPTRQRCFIPSISQTASFSRISVCWSTGAAVAAEVRQLAQRSAVAAKAIKSLTAESVGQIDEGGRQVSQAGLVIDEIVQQFDTVATLITQISTAVAEQSSGIGQVNQAVNDMDRVTRQNPALVEQSAAAAQSLANQARVLSAGVSTVRLQDA
ncbi:MAG: hypothetical protein J0M20_06565 [Burkholderiales bacterium]|nr:hypothetical protein [Burkholderiales bacterium]